MSKLTPYTPTFAVTRRELLQMGAAAIAGVSFSGNLIVGRDLLEV